MEITPPPNLLNAATLTRTAPEIRNWQVGQVLQATVQEVPGNGLASLRIGTQTLLAQLQFPVFAGQKLSLEVTQLGDLPQLRAVLPAPLQKAIEQALLRALPKQAAHTQLLANLHQASKPDSPVQLPTTVQQVVRAIYQSLPNTQQLSTPQGVKQAIQDSGIFLESRLTHTGNPIQGLQSDFKANLLRLYRAITQSLPPAGNETGTETKRTVGSPQNPPTTPLQAPLPGAVLRPTPSFTAPLQAPLKPEIPAQEQASSTSTATSTAAGTAGEITRPLPQAGDGAKTATPAAGGDTGTNRPGTPLPENLTAQRQLASSLAGAALPGRIAVNPLPGANEQAPIIPAFNLLNWKQPVAQARSSANLSFHESLLRLMTSLLKDTESSLARIQMNQLHSQRADAADQKPGWVFEIPIRRENGTDIFHFHVERDGEHQNAGQEQQDRWTVNMAFHLEELGAIHCRVTVWNQDVSVLFWASQDETMKLFNQHMADLQQRLESNGLSVNKLSCLRGTPPPKEDKPLQQTLLNEKA